MFLISEYIKNQQDEFTEQNKSYFQDADQIAIRLNTIIVSQQARREQISSMISTHLNSFWQTAPTLNETEQHLIKLNHSLLTLHNISFVYADINGTELTLNPELKKESINITKFNVADWVEQSHKNSEWKVKVLAEKKLSYFFNLIKLNNAKNISVVLRFEDPIQSNYMYEQGHNIFLVQNDMRGVQVHSNHLEPVFIAKSEIHQTPQALEYSHLIEETENIKTINISEKLDGDITYYEISNFPNERFILNTFSIDTLNAQLLIFTDAEHFIEEVNEEAYELLGKFVILLIILLILTVIFNYNSRLNFIAKHDILTGLLNRVHYSSHINEYIELHNRGKLNNVGVLAVDIDQFKPINDRFGHGKGDIILTLVGQLLKDTVRNSDFVYRFGGEEFLIICINDELESLKILAERLRHAVEHSAEIRKELGKPLTVSIGLTLRTKSEKIDDTLNRADKFLYQAKKNGRNQVVFDI